MNKLIWTRKVVKVFILMKKVQKLYDYCAQIGGKTHL